MSSGIKFERSYADAYEKRLFGPGITFLASNSDGSFQYEKGFGVHSWKSGVSERPFDKKTFVRLASCTKLLGSIAALQCVEKGLLDLDADVTGLLPELKDKEIVTMDADEKFIVHKNTMKITLRQLLTHTAGAAYSIFHPVLAKWQQQQGGTNGYVTSADAAQRFDVPFAFKPGTGWAYGIGIDWAGRMVARVNKQNLEDYMQQHIFAPLGIKGITFWPDRYPDLEAGLAGMCLRNPETGLAEHTEEDRFIGNRTEEMAGAHGHAVVEDYFKVMLSLLKDDGKLLQPETAKMLFEPQLGPASKAVLNAIGVGARGMNAHIECPKYGLDHGLGGALCDSDVPNFRRKYSLHWGGFPNLSWFIDKEQDLCGFAATQMYQTGDEIMHDLDEEWSKGIYEMHNAFKAGK